MVERPAYPQEVPWLGCVGGGEGGGRPGLFAQIYKWRTCCLLAPLIISRSTLGKWEFFLAASRYLHGIQWSNQFPGRCFLFSSSTSVWSRQGGEGEGGGGDKSWKFVLWMERGSCLWMLIDRLLDLQLFSVLNRKETIIKFRWIERLSVLCKTHLISSLSPLRDHL